MNGDHDAPSPSAPNPSDPGAPGRGRPVSRRHFLTRAAQAALAVPAVPALLAALPASGCDADGGGRDLRDPRPDVTFPAYAASPFTLGVASGAPVADGFVLWTRVALDPLATDAVGGMTGDDVPVYWEVADDAGFERLVARGIATAEARWAHSVHVEVDGLDPDRWYFYRFEIGAHASAVGRARTLPRASASPERFVMAVTSCQEWRDGYYASHRHLAHEQDLDLVVFLGDYIYEYGFREEAVRDNLHDAPRTLDEYRLRYAQYKGDADLQAAHARCPWALTWDDHEVQNNYAGAVSEDGEDDFLDRRAAAYQAYWEHLPLRGGPPEGPDLRVYGDLVVGDLAHLFLLDLRQHRDEQPCGGLGAPCDELADADLLGPEQEAWLTSGLAAATARWKVLGNPVVFAPLPVRVFPESAPLYSFDQWDGYPRSRDAVLDTIRAHAIDNVVIVTGDVHSLGVGRVHDGGEDASTPVLATEIVAPSTTSDASYLAQFEHIVLGIPWVDEFSVTDHGYARVAFTRAEARVDFMVVDDHTDPDSAQRVHSSWAIADGVAGATRLDG